MSKRKQESGFGSEIDDMLGDDASDDEGVLMSGGAAMDDEEGEDDMIGAQPSLTGESRATAEAMDEEDEAGEGEKEGDNNDYGEDEEMDQTEGNENDEYLAEDDEEDLPETENVESTENLFDILGLGQQQTQQTQIDSVEPSNKMKKLAMQRARTRVKRATSMYMLFSIHTGSKLEKGTSFKDRAAIIKKQYQEMVDVPEQKDEWIAKAEADKARFEHEIKDAYDEELETLQQDGMPEEVVVNADASLSSLSKTKDLILPLARVKKTVKLDPEVKNIAKEGAVAMTKATELFIAYLGIKCAGISALRGGKTIQERDFIHLANSNKTLDFLQEDFPRREQDEKKKKPVKELQAGADSEAVDAEGGAQGGVAPALRKKSRLETAAEGSAQLGSFFSKAPVGETLAPAPLRAIAKPSSKPQIGERLKNTPTPSTSKRASGGSRSSETDSGKRRGGRGEDRLNAAETSPAVVDQEGDADAALGATESSSAKKGSESKGKGKGKGKGKDKGKGMAKAASSGGNNLMALFGAKGASPGAQPAADIEDLM